MSDTDPLPSTPKGSSLERVITAIGAIYQRIEDDQRAFLGRAEEQGAPLRCPPGCGSCCEPFVPDILPVEAAYAAAWILQNKPELAKEIIEWKDRPATTPCPLLIRTDEGLRCSIYPARFLICRLFGASGIRDKDGRPTFRPCAHMPVPGLRIGDGDNPPIDDDRLVSLFGAEPPVMADYGPQVVSLSPSEGGERRSLYEALPVALVRVGLCLSLATSASDGTYSSEHESEARSTKPSPDPCCRG
jgi:uncharacterized protein